MIVYSNNKSTFLDDVSSRNIEDIIRDSYKATLNKNVGQKEYDSWRSSLGYMFHILNDDEIPDNANVAIEYHIPQTNNRIDFIITNEQRNEGVLCVFCR